MLALSSHHFIERTPTGEDAWRQHKLLPDDRRVLGALRTGLTVSVLMDDLSLEPSTLQVVLGRLVRRGFVRIDNAAPVESTPSHQEDVSIEILPSQTGEENALSSLLARHAKDEPVSIDDVPDEVEHSVESGSHPVEKSLPDESPLPVHGTKEDLGLLMEVLRHGPAVAQVPSVVDSDHSLVPSATHDKNALEKLMEALSPSKSPSSSSNSLMADLSLRSDSSPPPVSQSELLRIKENNFSSRPVSPDGITIPLASMPRKPTKAEQEANFKAIEDAQRAYATKRRLEKEQQALARRQEMEARRQVEQKKDQETSILGVSERLRKALSDQQKNS